MRTREQQPVSPVRPRRCFLHIGLPKTATTYLQTILWDQREAVAAQGLVLPGRERRDHLWVSRVAREEPDGRRRPDREHAAMARVLADVEETGADVLVSHEFFAAASAEQAAALREEDYQLAYAIDILKGLTVLETENLE